MLIDASTGELRFEMASNIKPHQMEDIVVPMEGSYAGWIVTHGEPRVIEAESQSSEGMRVVEKAIDFKTRNLLGVPMRTQRR
jgi:hypothetical protein